MQNGSEENEKPAAGPPNEITLERHAEVSALIAEGDKPYAKVLEEQGISDDAWNKSTEYWMMEMANDAQKNGAKTTLPIIYSDVFGKTQGSLKPVPPMTPEEWAGLTVEIQQSGSPTQPLAVRNLSTADYLRLARHFSQVLSRDGVANERFFAAYQALQPQDE